MDHVAIMKKSWGLIPKILSGEKVIESRWYQTRRAPWGKIAAGDTVYFKNSGEPVMMMARVSKVLSFDELTPKKVKALLKQYAAADGLSFKSLPKFYERFKNKRYCLLIFLETPRLIKPFQIDKRGFGLMAAWLSVGTIRKVKI